MGFLIVRPFNVADDQFISSNVTEDDYPAWNIATDYSLGDRVTVIDDDVHNVYESLIAGTDTNTGNDPQADLQWPNGTPVKWILVSKTNRWKMFDEQNSSQTSNADSIEVELSFTQRPNAVALLNVDCASIQVIQYDSMANVVYDQTQAMIESSGTPSHYGWLFQQIQKKTDALFENLIPISGGTIEIILANEGGTVKCGTCLVGYSEDFGGTQYGAGVGIQDYSVKQRSEFGDLRILERAYNRNGDFTVMVQNSVIDRLQNLLASRRAKATLYIAAKEYRCTYIYGFFTEMQNVITYPEDSLLNIDITGLT